MNTANLAVMGPSDRVPVVQSDTGAMIAMFERLVRDPSVSMDRIERATDMLRELRREQAEEAYNDAMAQVQLEITPIARDSFNPQTRSKYASYHAVDKAIRPIRTKHGIAVSFDEAETSPENYIRVYAFVSKGRHTRRFHYDSPIVTTGLKGLVNMTMTHARASAVSYAKRYLMGMIFDLSTGEDDDGNTAGGNAIASAHAIAPITEMQMEELEALIKEVNANTANVCKACHVESIADLTQAQFEKAKAKLETMRTPL